MKKGNEREPILPLINSAKNHQKPIKEILKDLKQRRMVIESRIKTQVEQSQPEEKDENDSHFRERIITEVPYYINRRSYYKRENGSESLDNIKLQSKINEEHQLEESGRQSNLKTQIRKRNSILYPIPDNERKIELTPKSKREKLRQIQELCVLVPVDPKERTEQSIRDLKIYLIENNIFFSKIHNVIATCILKLNRLMWLEKGQVLYRKGEERNAFYIVLFGRMKLYDPDKNLKKICHSGESIGQESLFSTKIRKPVKQSTKAVSRCFLVELKIQNYKKMSEQMTRYGYRVIFNEMESILKRNYITKNWLRGQKERFEKKY